MLKFDNGRSRLLAVPMILRTTCTGVGLKQVTVETWALNWRHQPMEIVTFGRRLTFTTREVVETPIMETQPMSPEFPVSFLAGAAAK